MPCKRYQIIGFVSARICERSAPAGRVGKSTKKVWSSRLLCKWPVSLRATSLPASRWGLIHHHDGYHHNTTSNG